jgi:hypothetical protein
MEHDLNLVMDYNEYSYGDHTRVEFEYSKMAKELIDKGWTKIVWHKVADNDLPIKDDWYICTLTDGKVTWARPMKFRQNTFVIPEDPRVFDGIAHKQVIAWADCPEYKETKDE